MHSLKRVSTFAMMYALASELNFQCKTYLKFDRFCLGSVGSFKVQFINCCMVNKVQQSRDKLGKLYYNIMFTLVQLSSNSLTLIS